jgi:hypothetical protein
VGVKDRFELALFGLKNLTAGDGQPLEKPGHVNNAAIPPICGRSCWRGRWTGRSLRSRWPHSRLCAAPTAPARFSA